MVTTCQFKVYQKKVFNKFSRFILIGNNIDGFVNFDMMEFDNFDAVKFWFPNIIKNLKVEGEWDLKLYQINSPIKFKRPYGYYREPAQGKLIFNLSYINMAKHRMVTINDALIHVYSYNDLDFDEYDQFGKPKDGTIYEEYVTVLLFQERELKSDVMEQFINS